MNDASLIARHPQRLTLDVLGMYVREHGAQLWAGGLVQLLGDLGFSVGAARVAVQRLCARGLLERRKEGRRVRLAVSRLGEELLREGDARIFGFGRAPVRRDLWTLVWHQLPASRHADRQELVTRLRFGGFGQVRDGLWIAAGNRSAIVGPALRELRLEDQVGVLVGRPAGAFDPATIWDQATLLDAYRAFLDGALPVGDLGRLSDREAFLCRAELMHAYQRFTRLDPELPDAASVTDARTRAVALFDDRYRRLAEPAARHVRSALWGGGAPVQEEGK